MEIFVTILALLVILIGGGFWEARKYQKTELPDLPEQEEEDEGVARLGRS